MTHGTKFTTLSTYHALRLPGSLPPPARQHVKVLNRALFRGSSLCDDACHHSHTALHWWKHILQQQCWGGEVSIDVPIWLIAFRVIRIRCDEIIEDGERLHFDVACRSEELEIITKPNIQQVVYQTATVTEQVYVC